MSLSDGVTPAWTMHEPAYPTTLALNARLRYQVGSEQYACNCVRYTEVLFASLKLGTTYVPLS